MKSDQQTIIHNILLSLLLGLIIFSIEFTFNLVHPASHYQFSWLSACVILILLFAITFLRYELSIIILLFFSFGFAFVEMMHMQYFGTWVYPIEIIMFFRNTGEVYNSMSSMKQSLVAPALIMVSAMLLSFLFLKVFKRRIKFCFSAWVLLVLMFILALILNITQDNEKLRQNIKEGIFVNGYRALSSFLIVSTPALLFDNGQQQQPLPSPLKMKTPDPNRNIIFGIR